MWACVAADHNAPITDQLPSSHLAHSSPLTTSFSAAETHHPSLRRRKWLEQPGSSLAGGGAPGVVVGTVVGSTGVQQLRQSALEKSLSLQAELAQQRPLSMVVPFGGCPLEPGNSIVNQVADSLLQQVTIMLYLYLCSRVEKQMLEPFDAHCCHIGTAIKASCARPG